MLACELPPLYSCTLSAAEYVVHVLCIDMHVEHVAVELVCELDVSFLAE